MIVLTRSGVVSRSIIPTTVHEQVVGILLRVGDTKEATNMQCDANSIMLLHPLCLVS
jgi:hypothetical protein